MSPTADLHVLAQIAITLAGFTGIIGVFQQRSGNILTDRERLHIVNLLQATAVIVFLAFVPSCLTLLPIVGLDIWAWSIRILFAVHILAWIIGSISLTRFLSIINSLPKTERAIIFGLLLPAGIATTVVEGLVVAGHWTNYTTFIYEVALIFFLGIAFVAFISLLLKPE
ncbi:MAG: hypothetical protein ACI9BW_002581 [Gammaproteobacteria bacterium]|jgi:hypothetical protein